MPERLFKSYFSLLAFSIACAIPDVSAQYQESDFTRYTVKEGLSDNGISCLQQDDRGYLWIGTEAGLNRFDGHSFKKFYQNTPPLQLRSGNIRQMKRFGPNRLGIVTRGGFMLLNVNTYSVQDFYIPDSTTFTTYLNSVWDVEGLSDGSFAISTAAGFIVSDTTGRIIFRHDAFNIGDITNKRILYGREIYKLNENRLLVYVGERGLASYGVEKRSFRELNGSESSYHIFSHRYLSDLDHWVVNQQISDDEFVFIPLTKDIIIYYNHALKKNVSSPLPFHILDALNWTSKIFMLNDSTIALNHKTKGFFLLHINRKTGEIKGDGKMQLPEYKIICLFADKEKRLWVGTSEGLLKQNLQQPVIRSFHYPPADPGELANGVFTCSYRHKDKLYAGRFAGRKGLVVIDPEDMKLIDEITFYETANAWNTILSMEMYHRDTLYIGTNAGLLWYDTQSGKYGPVLDGKKYPWANDFYPILAPPRPDGYAWMCSLLGGKVVRYHIPTRTFTLFTSKTQPALPFDRVKNIAYDSYGDVWIGGHSLARWNNQKHDFDTLITVYGGANKFDDDILTLSADNEGSLWLHNAFNGLLEYRIREKRFIPYSMKDGLPSEVLQSLSTVKEDKLWVAGNNHAVLVDTRNKKFTVYDYADGFPEQKPTGRRIYHDTLSGKMYLCCNEYIVTFPYTPEARVDNSSGLIIQEVTVDHNETFHMPSDKIDINYSKNNVWINCTIIDFEKSNYQFAYRLNDTDPWNVVGDQRNISLDHLPPGPYTIQLRASGKPGIEKTNKLSIVIRSPFWRTGWFIGIALAVILIGSYLILRTRIRNIRQKANIDKLLAQTEIKALQAQMNPHFIFNSLNSIGEMILNNENKQASHYLSKFARLIRITLDQSSQSIVSLRNTIDYLERYMEMENIRNSYFTHKITVDPELDIDETTVPPMLIQPFIENALWHGVSANKKDIHVQIDFIKEDDTLVCKIDDNGVGIRQTDHSKENGAGHQPVGIANIQNRVALLNEKYDLHGHITIMDKKDIPGSTETGTLVTLQLPLEIEEV